MNNHRDVNLGRSDMAIHLADEAERLISAALAREAGSNAPTIDRAAGEIDMAYKLKLIDYPRRDVLISQLREIVNQRRKELLKQRHDRMMRTEA